MEGVNKFFRGVLIISSISLYLFLSSISVSARIPNESEYKECVEKYHSVLWDSEDNSTSSPDDNTTHIEKLTQKQSIAISKAVEIAKGASGTKHERAKYLHDELCKRFSYDLDSVNYNYTDCIRGFTTGKAKCVGYAQAYMLLCSLSDIPCLMVYGKVDGTESHAWNIIQLEDGEWYEIDATFDDDNQYCDYCMITTEQMNKTRKRGGYGGLDGEDIWGKQYSAAELPIASGRNYNYSIPIESITIEGPTTAPIGSSITLKANVQPENATNKNVVWWPSDLSMVTADSNGNIVGIKPGKVTITAEAQDSSGYVASYEITVVEPVLISSISISGNHTVQVGNTIQLTTEILPNNASTESIYWSSFDSGIAMVDEDGRVTGVKEGKTTIYASAMDGSGVYDSFEINVKGADISVSKIEITGEKILKVGSHIQLKAIVSPQNATINTVTWASSDVSIATIGNDGKLFAKKAGKITVKASAQDGSGIYTSHEVTVIGKDADPARSKIVKRVSSLRASAKGKNQVKVSWKKQKSAFRYEIQISGNKKFTKNLISKTISNNKGHAIIKCKAVKDKYIRIRAVDKNGYVGKWSKAKKVK